MKNIIFNNDYYVISNDFKLLDYNKSVEETYKGIKRGDLCYKATMNRDTPCLHCPIAGNSDCDNPIYFDPFYNEWVEAIFTEIEKDKYGVLCRPAKDRGLRVFDNMGKEDNEELVEMVAGGAANKAIKGLAVKLDRANEEQGAQLEEILALNDELKEANDKVSLMLGMIEGLSREYHTIVIVDKETLKKQLVRSSGISTIMAAIQLDAEYDDYDKNFKFYIDRFVDPVDKKRVWRAVNSKSILKKLEKTDFYSVNYLRIGENGKVGFHQVAFINVDSTDGKKYFVYGLRDIDTMIKNEKKAKQALIKARKQAELASNAKSSFLFNMSHDIRTPMNAIIGFTELLQKNLDDREKAEGYLRKIQESNAFLLSLINNVLEMARIESGKITLEESFWDARLFNDTMFSVFSESMKKKGVTFTRNINVEHDSVFCDTTKVREIFLNLLGNAQKYTPAGGHVHMELTEIPSNRKGYAMYKTEITDNGIGMSKEYVSRIFEEFTREKTSTESRVEGSGLGMAIVKSLVDLMKGTIEVESELGKGTRITVILPHRIATEEEIKKIAVSSADAEKISFEGKRALLAEDNELNAEISIEILSQTGFEVDWVNNGLDCVEMLKKQPSGYYDIIFMDVQMPIMNGYEASKEIRKLDDSAKANIPILAVTANAFEEDKLEARRAGMTGHLSKPIKIHEMYKEIAKYI